MAMTLIKETGAGLADANTYADLADFEAYTVPEGSEYTVNGETRHLP